MELSVDRTQLSELPRDVLGHPKCPGVHILLSTAVSVTLYTVHVHEIHWIMSMELSVYRTQLSELPRDVLGHPKCPGVHILLSTAVSVPHRTWVRVTKYIRSRQCGCMSIERSSPTYPEMF